MGGQTLVGHERVTNEHDLVLSPSECGQKIGKIAIARDEDNCGWRLIVLDESHDIHWSRRQHRSVVSNIIGETRLSSSSLQSFSHRCGGSLLDEVSQEERYGGRVDGPVRDKPQD